MNAKISMFVICAEAMYLLTYNLHDCTFKKGNNIEQEQTTSSWIVQEAVFLV